jgi:N-acyl-D-amino-acid deacylase
MRANIHKLLSLTLILAVSATALAQGRNPASFDVLIKGGTVYDGSGRPPRQADVGIKGDRIAAIGNLNRATATTVVDAKGLAVAPGFINMLSHSESSLIVDPRSLSEIKQGVTTQIFGEGSMGPLNDQMKQRLNANRGDSRFQIEWTTLAEYLTYLEKRGILKTLPRLLERQPFVRT